MKMSEILIEELPGAKKSSWLSKFMPSDDVRLAKQNQKKWYNVVKKLQQSGKNMNDQNVYRRHLYAFLSSNNRIKLSDTIKKQIGTADLTDRSILDIMTQTVSARRTAKGKAQ